MITAQEAREKYADKTPIEVRCKDFFDKWECQVKKGYHKIHVATTYMGSENVALILEHLKKNGYDAHFDYYYNQRTGQRGGNYIEAFI